MGNVARSVSFVAAGEEGGMGCLAIATLDAINFMAKHEREPFHCRAAPDFLSASPRPDVPRSRHGQID